MLFRIRKSEEALRSGNNLQLAFPDC